MGKQRMWGSGGGGGLDGVWVNTECGVAGGGGGVRW